MLVFLALFGLLLLFMPLNASAQQQPSWEDIALQAQRNVASEQMLSIATITALQAEIAALKAELERMKEPPKQ